MFSSALQLLQSFLHFRARQAGFIEGRVALRQQSLVKRNAELYDCVISRLRLEHGEQCILGPGKFSGAFAIRFTPPAPLALITLRNIATGASASDVPMLLDSGADVSLLKLI